MPSQTAGAPPQAAAPGDEPRRSGVEVRAFPARAISEHVTRGEGAVASLARQYRVLETLRQASSLLVVERPLEELFERLLDLLFESLPAQRGAIMVQQGDPPRLELRASRSRSGAPFVSVSRSIASRVVQEGVALLLEDAMQHPQFRRAESLVIGGVRSALCAPLWVSQGDGEQVLGIVYLDSPGVSHAFDAEDVGLVTAIANIAAVKVQTAQLAREQAESRRLQEEIRLAAEVQSRLLPRAVPPLRGWSLGTMSRPCHSMGGDYFDWELAGDGLRLAFADVAGKGTAAALLMAAVRALVRAHWGERDLAKAAETVSRAVFDSVPEGRYATAFLARLDPVGGQLHYVNAGHQPPILVRRNGDVELLESQGFPLGLVEATAYQSGLTTLAPGDTLLVFSDGVCEAKDGRGAELGPAALVAHARQALGLDAAALAATIERAIDAHSQGTPADDDRTLLVLRRTPPHARRP